MNTLESELTGEEFANAEEFYEKLKEPDLGHVKRIVSSVDLVANSYFLHRQQDRNYYVFCKDEKVGTPFFAVYLIGGCLNKEGERPDIDLLVASNVRYTRGFLNLDFDTNPDDWDPIYAILFKEFKEKGSIQLSGELPEDYDIGGTKGKSIITIQPVEGKKLDINYVRYWLKEFRFINEGDFLKIDVGKNGEPLTRLPIYRKTSDITLPKWKP